MAQLFEVKTASAAKASVAASQVNYKNVMSEYKLGPNGGILTACNLFATRFDQVMRLCEKPRDPPLETIVVDTAGQIEIFTWSASGNIVTELFASSFPTVVLYVIDTPRCLSPQTFMSNMMQACSILYKTRLPMVLVRGPAGSSSTVPTRVLAIPCCMYTCSACANSCRLCVLQRTDHLGASIALYRHTFASCVPGADANPSPRRMSQGVHTSNAQKEGRGGSGAYCAPVACVMR